MNFNEMLDMLGYAENTKQQYGYYVKYMPPNPTQEDIDYLVLKHNNNVFRAFLKLYLYDFLKVPKDERMEGHIIIPKIRGRGIKKEMIFLTAEEIDKLYAISNTRLKIIILLGFRSGLRIGEILGIRRSDIDFSKKEIRIMGKGGKESRMPVTDLALGLLEEYAQGLSADDKVFPTYRQAINHQLAQISKGVLGYPISSHVLRRSCGRHLRRSGMDVVQIQKFLRHSKLDTTERYTTATKEEVRKTWQQIMNPI